MVLSKQNCHCVLVKHHKNPPTGRGQDSPKGEKTWNDDCSDLSHVGLLQWGVPGGDYKGGVSWDTGGMSAVVMAHKGRG